MFPLPIDVEPNFRALDALPELGSLSYDGSSPRFSAYVIARKLKKVRWRRHGQSTIDLRKSRVDELTLEVTGPTTLLAPESLDQLWLSGRVESAHGERRPHWLPVFAPDRGASLAFRAAGSRGRSAARLPSPGRSRYLAPHLLHATRRAHLRGAPGKLTRASGLASLPTLRELSLYELYELDTNRWPMAWPGLEGVRIKGLKKADAERLKEALAEVPDVRISGARTDAWLAVNLGNPFRDWEQDDRAFEGACAAWVKTKKAAEALGPKASKKKAEPVLQGLVTTLNQLNKKHDIDTLRREQAAEAFFQLADDLGIQKKQSEAWFDAWRDF